jgi:hypothetical protein
LIAIHYDFFALFSRKFRLSINIAFIEISCINTLKLTLYRLHRRKAKGMQGVPVSTDPAAVCIYAHSFFFCSLCMQNTSNQHRFLSVAHMDLEVSLQGSKVLLSYPTAERRGWRRKRGWGGMYICLYFSAVSRVSRVAVLQKSCLLYSITGVSKLVCGGGGYRKLYSAHEGTI